MSRTGPTIDEGYYAAKLHTNSVGFVQFSHEIANDYTTKYALNTKIYPWLNMAMKMTSAETTIEHFIRISTRPAAADRTRYKTTADLPVVDGKSRFPYWESVRTRDIEFFIGNVALLMPEVDMRKIAYWQTLIPDLQYFTNENITAEISKILTLFKNRVLPEDDIAILWEYFDMFIEHAVKYIHHRRKRERGYLGELDLRREVVLFKIKDLDGREETALVPA